jgi:hypothetical protein
VISEEEFQEAERRGRETMENVPHVVAAMYIPTIRRVLITFDSGLEIALRQDDYSWMRHANESDLSKIEILGGGLILDFSKLDEGFYMPDLLEHLLHVRRFLKREVEQDEASATHRAA